MGRREALDLPRMSLEILCFSAALEIGFSKAVAQ